MGQIDFLVADSRQRSVGILAISEDRATLRNSNAVVSAFLKFSIFCARRTLTIGELGG
jgi:hypothetical protein